MTGRCNAPASANLPLHGGKAPAWLFQRMVRRARIEPRERGQALDRLARATAEGG